MATQRQYGALPGPGVPLHGHGQRCEGAQLPTEGRRSEALDLHASRLRRAGAADPCLPAPDESQAEGVGRPVARRGGYGAPDSVDVARSQGRGRRSMAPGPALPAGIPDRLARWSPGVSDGHHLVHVSHHAEGPTPQAVQGGPLRRRGEAEDQEPRPLLFAAVSLFCLLRHAQEHLSFPGHCHDGIQALVPEGCLQGVDGLQAVGGRQPVPWLRGQAAGGLVQLPGRPLAGRGAEPRRAAAAALKLGGGSALPACAVLPHACERALGGGESPGL
mmetsp:Transcript_51959/g.155174  ORF Transcript_51959/g.155174 Transcript_51959/m.155174 type:complete len:274 (-) Transcript_51959:14-835(-)